MGATPAPGRLDTIVPGVRRLTAPNGGPMTGPGTNTYLVGEEAVVVIDPGVEDAAHIDAIVAHAPGPIRTILITHAHPDHTGGAATLARMTGAPVLGQGTPLAGAFDPDFAVDRTVDDGQIIACDGFDLEAVHTPGHTPDHLCFFLRETGLLFAGDAVMADVTVVIAPPDGDMRAYFSSLDRLKAMSVERIAPGHGRVLDAPADVLDHIVEHRRQREAQVLEMLAPQAQTVAALAARIYPGVPEALRGMAQAQLTAHLIKLQGEGQVQSDGEDWIAAS